MRLSFWSCFFVVSIFTLNFALWLFWSPILNLFVHNNNIGWRRVRNRFRSLCDLHYKYKYPFALSYVSCICYTENKQSGGKDVLLKKRYEMQKDSSICKFLFKNNFLCNVYCLLNKFCEKANIFYSFIFATFLLFKWIFWKPFGCIQRKFIHFNFLHFSWTRNVMDRWTRIISLSTKKWFCFCFVLFSAISFWLRFVYFKCIVNVSL